MAGRQLSEFLARFGMLFQHGCQFGGHGNIARCGVELERYADYVTRIAAAACFAERGVDLQAITGMCFGLGCVRFLGAAVGCLLLWSCLIRASAMSAGTSTCRIIQIL